MSNDRASSLRANTAPISASTTAMNAPSGDPSELTMPLNMYSCRPFGTMRCRMPPNTLPGGGRPTPTFAANAPENLRSSAADLI